MTTPGEFRDRITFALDAYDKLNAENQALISRVEELSGKVVRSSKALLKIREIAFSSQISEETTIIHRIASETLTFVVSDETTKVTP